MYARKVKKELGKKELKERSREQPKKVFNKSFKEKGRKVCKKK